MRKWFSMSIDYLYCCICYLARICAFIVWCKTTPICTMYDSEINILYWIYPSITIIARNLFGSAISTCRSITSLEKIKTANQAMNNLWALKLNLLKGFETFWTCFFHNQCIMAFRRTSTNFLWSDPASIGVIMRKMLGKFCCTPLKMCVQLPLLERDSSFVVVQKQYTVYIQYRREVEISYEHVRTEETSLTTLAEL